MGLNLSPSLKHSLGPVMTPRLQQAIKILTYTNAELLEVIRDECLQNPLLEDKSLDIESNAFESVPFTDTFYDNAKGMREGDLYSSNKKNLEEYVSSEESAIEYLLWQFGALGASDLERLIAETIIRNLDDTGFLSIGLEDLAQEEVIAGISLESIEKVLEKIQGLDPLGVGARDIRECFLIQAKGHRHYDCYDIILNCWEFLLNREKTLIAEKLSMSEDRVNKAIELMSFYEQRPLARFSKGRNHYIIPDVIVEEEAGLLKVRLNEEFSPKLELNEEYVSLLKGSRVREDSKFLNEKVKSANWFIQSVQNRKKTILLVAQTIVAIQHEFFKNKNEKLSPMILKDIATNLDIHESTVSRAVHNKYMMSPVGIFELKYFFNAKLGENEDISVDGIRKKIEGMIQSEEPQRPYSDQKIVNLLASEGIKIARRTVTKYREQLGIDSSSKRKKYLNN